MASVGRVAFRRSDHLPAWNVASPHDAIRAADVIAPAEVGAGAGAWTSLGWWQSVLTAAIARLGGGEGGAAGWAASGAGARSVAGDDGDAGGQAGCAQLSLSPNAAIALVLHARQMRLRFALADYAGEVARADGEHSDDPRHTRALSTLGAERIVQLPEALAGPFQRCTTPPATADEHGQPLHDQQQQEQQQQQQQQQQQRRQVPSSVVAGWSVGWAPSSSLFVLGVALRVEVRADVEGSSPTARLSGGDGTVAVYSSRGSLLSIVEPPTWAPQSRDAALALASSGLASVLVREAFGALPRAVGKTSKSSGAADLAAAAAAKMMSSLPGGGTGPAPPHPELLLVSVRPPAVRRLAFGVVTAGSGSGGAKGTDDLLGDGGLSLSPYLDAAAAAAMFPRPCSRTTVGGGRGGGANADSEDICVVIGYSAAKGTPLSAAAAAALASRLRLCWGGATPVAAAVTPNVAVIWRIHDRYGARASAQETSWTPLGIVELDCPDLRPPLPMPRSATPDWGALMPCMVFAPSRHCVLLHVAGRVAVVDADALSLVMPWSTPSSDEKAGSASGHDEWVDAAAWWSDSAVAVVTRPRASGDGGSLGRRAKLQVWSTPQTDPSAGNQKSGDAAHHSVPRDLLMAASASAVNASADASAAHEGPDDNCFFDVLAGGLATAPQPGSTARTGVQPGAAARARVLLLQRSTIGQEALGATGSDSRDQPGGLAGSTMWLSSALAQDSMQLLEALVASGTANDARTAIALSMTEAPEDAPPADSDAEAALPPSQARALLLRRRAHAILWQSEASLSKLSSMVRLSAAAVGSNIVAAKSALHSLALALPPLQRHPLRPPSLLAHPSLAWGRRQLLCAVPDLSWAPASAAAPLLSALNFGLAHTMLAPRAAALEVSDTIGKYSSASEFAAVSEASGAACRLWLRQHRARLSMFSAAGLLGNEHEPNALEAPRMLVPSHFRSLRDADAVSVAMGVVHMAVIEASKRGEHDDAVAAAMSALRDCEAAAADNGNGSNDFAELAVLRDKLERAAMLAAENVSAAPAEALAAMFHLDGVATTSAAGAGAKAPNVRVSAEANWVRASLMPARMLLLESLPETTPPRAYETLLPAVRWFRGADSGANTEQESDGNSALQAPAETASCVVFGEGGTDAWIERECRRSCNAGDQHGVPHLLQFWHSRGTSCVSFSVLEHPGDDGCAAASTDDDELAFLARVVRLGAGRSLRHLAAISVSDIKAASTEDQAALDAVASSYADDQQGEISCPGESGYVDESQCESFFRRRLSATSTSGAPPCRGWLRGYPWEAVGGSALPDGDAGSSSWAACAVAAARMQSDVVWLACWYERRARNIDSHAARPDLALALLEIAVQWQLGCEERVLAAIAAGAAMPQSEDITQLHAGGVRQRGGSVKKSEGGPAAGSFTVPAEGEGALAAEEACQAARQRAQLAAEAIAKLLRTRDNLRCVCAAVYGPSPMNAGDVEQDEGEAHELHVARAAMAEMAPGRHGVVPTAPLVLSLEAWEKELAHEEQPRRRLLALLMCGEVEAFESAACGADAASAATAAAVCSGVSESEAGGNAVERSLHDAADRLVCAFNSRVATVVDVAVANVQRRARADAHVRLPDAVAARTAADAAGVEERVAWNEAIAAWLISICQVPPSEVLPTNISASSARPGGHLRAAAVLLEASRPTADVPLAKRPIRSPMLLLRTALGVAYAGENVAYVGDMRSTLAALLGRQQPEVDGIVHSDPRSEATALDSIINCLPGANAYTAAALALTEARVAGKYIAPECGTTVDQASANGGALEEAADEDGSAAVLHQHFLLLQMQVDELELHLDAANRLLDYESLVGASCPRVVFWRLAAKAALEGGEGTCAGICVNINADPATIAAGALAALAQEAEGVGLSTAPEAGCMLLLQLVGSALRHNLRAVGAARNALLSENATLPTLALWDAAQWRGLARDVRWLQMRLLPWVHESVLGCCLLSALLVSGAALAETVHAGEAVRQQRRANVRASPGEHSAAVPASVFDERDAADLKPEDVGDEEKEDSVDGALPSRQLQRLKGYLREFAELAALWCTGDADSCDGSRIDGVLEARTAASAAEAAGDSEAAAMLGKVAAAAAAEAEAGASEREVALDDGRKIGGLPAALAAAVAVALARRMTSSADHNQPHGETTAALDHRWPRTAMAALANSALGLGPAAEWILESAEGAAVDAVNADAWCELRGELGLARGAHLLRALVTNAAAQQTSGPDIAEVAVVGSNRSRLFDLLAGARPSVQACQEAWDKWEFVAPCQDEGSLFEMAPLLPCPGLRDLRAALATPRTESTVHPVARVVMALLDAVPAAYATGMAEAAAVLRSDCVARMSAVVAASAETAAAASGDGGWARIVPNPDATAHTLAVSLAQLRRERRHARTGGIAKLVNPFVAFFLSDSSAHRGPAQDGENEDSDDCDYSGWCSDEEDHERAAEAAALRDLTGSSLSDELVDETVDAPGQGLRRKRDVVSGVLSKGFRMFAGHAFAAAEAEAKGVAGAAQREVRQAAEMYAEATGGRLDAVASGVVSGVGRGLVSSARLADVLGHSVLDGVGSVAQDVGGGILSVGAALGKAEELTQSFVGSLAAATGADGAQMADGAWPKCTVDGGSRLANGRVSVWMGEALVATAAAVKAAGGSDAKALAEAAAVAEAGAAGNADTSLALLARWLGQRAANMKAQNQLRLRREEGRRCSLEQRDRDRHGPSLGVDLGRGIGAWLGLGSSKAEPSPKAGDRDASAGELPLAAAVAPSLWRHLRRLPVRSHPSNPSLAVGTNASNNRRQRRRHRSRKSGWPLLLRQLAASGGLSLEAASVLLQRPPAFATRAAAGGVVPQGRDGEISEVQGWTLLSPSLKPGSQSEATSVSMPPTAAHALLAHWFGGMRVGEGLMYAVDVGPAWGGDSAPNGEQGNRVGGWDCPSSCNLFGAASSDSDSESDDDNANQREMLGNQDGAAFDGAECSVGPAANEGTKPPASQVHTSPRRKQSNKSGANPHAHNRQHEMRISRDQLVAFYASADPSKVRENSVLHLAMCDLLC